MLQNNCVITETSLGLQTIYKIDTTVLRVNFKANKWLNYSSMNIWIPENNFRKSKRFSFYILYFDILMNFGSSWFVKFQKIIGPMSRSKILSVIWLPITHKVYKLPFVIVSHYYPQDLAPLHQHIYGAKEKRTRTILWTINRDKPLSNRQIESLRVATLTPYEAPRFPSACCHWLVYPLYRSIRSGRDYSKVWIWRLSEGSEHLFKTS